jgi:CMP-N-acetylneuraminic acid synthetase
LALVPARAGIKGIPGKNTRYLAGRPLMAWAIDIGKQTCSDTMVSSEDRKIGMLATTCGAEWLQRPAALAMDDTPMLLVVKHAINSLPPPAMPDVVVLLQPTQPLRNAKHVEHALEMLASTGADSVVSVVEIPDHYTPDMAMRFDGERILPFNGHMPTRRQDARRAFSRDGTVYAIRTETLLEQNSLYGDDCRAFVVHHSQSANLDTVEDWNRAESLMGLKPRRTA